MTGTTTVRQTITDSILDSTLPANEKIQGLRTQRRMLKTAIKSCVQPETVEPGGRFYPMYIAMQRELGVLEVGMSCCYDLMIAANK